MGQENNPMHPFRERGKPRVPPQIAKLRWKVLQVSDGRSAFEAIWKLKNNRWTFIVRFPGHFLDENARSRHSKI